MRTHTTIIAAALVTLFVAGCGTAISAVDIAPTTVADISAASMYTYTSPSSKSSDEVKLAPRLGYVQFLGGDLEVASRPTLGAFGRMLESDDRRVEVGIDIVPSIDDERTNFYATLIGDYVGFLGSGTLFWKAGGGLAIERRADTTYVMALAEAGIGVWIPTARGQALIVAGTVQVPVGDANPDAMLGVTVGYEF